MEKKLSKPPVVESPIADVFENRHPSAAEKNWAEKTLAPTIEKAPERPVGAPTGVNIGEHGRARFTTISGVPVRRRIAGIHSDCLTTKIRPFLVEVPLRLKQNLSCVEPHQ